MNIIDAAHAVVHDNGGSEVLGVRMGMSGAVLRNKVNPRNDTHHLTLSEADRLTGLTGDTRILQALAHAHGYLLVKAPEQCRGESDMSVLEQLAALMVANGVFGHEIHAALSDGGVDPQEMARIEHAGRGVMTSVAEVKERIRGMVG